MVKANHLPRCVKGTLRNSKSVVGNFVTCTGGHYFRPIWLNMKSRLEYKMSVNKINYNKFHKNTEILNIVFLIDIHRAINRLKHSIPHDQHCTKVRLVVCCLQMSIKGIFPSQELFRKTSETISDSAECNV